MLDTVGEFLKACESPDLLAVETLRKILATDPDKTAIYTQGALLAARRHHWNVVQVLAPQVNISIERCALLRLSASEQQWECFEALTHHLNGTTTQMVIKLLEPNLMARDAGMGLKHLLTHLPSNPINSVELSVELSSLAVTALKLRAFECMKSVVEASQALDVKLDNLLRIHATTMWTVKLEAAQEFLTNLNDFNNWKEKQALEEAVQDISPSVGPRARKM